MIWHRAVAAQVQGKRTATVDSFCGFEPLHETERRGRSAVHQSPADSLGQPALQVDDLLRGRWKCEYLDGFDVRGNQIQRAIYHHQAWSAKSRKIISSEIRIAYCKVRRHRTGLSVRFCSAITSGPGGTQLPHRRCGKKKRKAVKPCFP